jgi:hypothetical protein
MTDLSPEARELFALARGSLSPDEERLARVGAALAAQIGGGLAVSAAASAASGAGKAGAVSGFVWPSAVKLVGIGLVLAGAAGSVVALRARSGPSTAAPREMETAVGPRAPSLQEPLIRRAAREPSSAPRDADTPPVEKNAPARVLGRASPASAASTGPRSSASAPLVTKVILEERDEPAAPVTRKNADTPATPVDDSLVGEVALLRDARAALASGAAGKALRILDQHAADYPRGTMVQERLATRVFALCMLGRTGEARASATALERTFPRSPHLERVRASCAGPGE